VNKRSTAARDHGITGQPRTTVGPNWAVAAIIAIASLVPALPSADQDNDSDAARELHEAGRILSLEHFIEQATRIHPGRVIDAELKWEDEHDHYVYEIEVLDVRGEVWELEFDAQRGGLLEGEKEDD
jgi:uncharacterized membrane protein YkoI